MGLLHHEDSATGINHAWVLLKLHFPRFSGIGQFRIHILSLVKIAYGAIIEEGLGIIEELRQGRQRPRRHGADFQPGRFAARRRLDPGAVDMGFGPGLTGRLAQEGALLEIAFEQMRFDRPGDGQDQARYARSAAEIGEAGETGRASPCR